MAYKTKSQLKAQVDAVIKVNGNREITPPLDNGIRTNFIDSFLALEGGNVLLSLTGYTSDLTPTDDKHLVPKKYIDDLLSSGIILADGSVDMNDSLNFTAGDKGLTWASGSSLKDNAGYLRAYGFTDIELTAENSLNLNSNSGDTNISSGNDILFNATGDFNIIASGISASTVVYLDASKNLISLANGAGVLTNNGSGTLSWTSVGVSDGDKGDITVSSSGTVWTIDNGVVSFSKLAALNSANILVGNVSNVAASVAMSGDITISNAGVTTIGANKADYTKSYNGTQLAISTAMKLLSGN